MGSTNHKELQTMAVQLIIRLRDKMCKVTASTFSSSSETALAISSFCSKTSSNIILGTHARTTVHAHASTLRCPIDLASNKTKSIIDTQIQVKATAK